MALYMKSDGDAEAWQRQLSTASTQLPSSPPMSRMVSPEKEIKDACANDEFSALPDEVYNAQPSKGVIAFLPVLGVLFIYGLLNSMSARIVIGAVAVLMLVVAFYLNVVNGCSLHHAWPENCTLESQRGESELSGKEEDNDSQKAGGAAARSWLSLIIGSAYEVCVYTSFVVFIGVVATLVPWALMLLPPVYLCLIADRRTEDCDEEDNVGQKEVGTPESPCPSVRLGSFIGTCTYLIIFVLIGVVAILTILLPAALVFSLQD